MIDFDWFWLILILIDFDWFWLILILIDFDWFWLCCLCWSRLHYAAYAALCRICCICCICCIMLDYVLHMRQPAGQPASQPGRQPANQPASPPTSQPASQPTTQPSRETLCSKNRKPASQAAKNETLPDGTPRAAAARIRADPRGWLPSVWGCCLFGHGSEAQIWS